MTNDPILVFAASATLLLAGLTACGPSDDDCSGCESCQYEDAPGIYEVTELVESDVSATCSGVTEIRLLFAPNNEPGPYKVTEEPPLGSVFAITCLETAGITVGAQLPGTLELITSGACAPVLNGTVDSPLEDCVETCQ